MNGEVCGSNLQNLLDAYGCSTNNAGWRRLAIFLAIEADKLEIPPAPQGGRIPNTGMGKLMLAHLDGQRRRGLPENVSQAARDTRTFLEHWGQQEREIGENHEPETLPSWQSIRKFYYTWRAQIEEWSELRAKGRGRVADIYDQAVLDAVTFDGHFARLEREARFLASCDETGPHAP